MLVRPAGRRLHRESTREKPLVLRDLCFSSLLLYSDTVTTFEFFFYFFQSCKMFLNHSSKLRHGSPAYLAKWRLKRIILTNVYKNWQVTFSQMTNKAARLI